LTGIKYLNEPLTLYRQHESTVTKTIAVKTSSRSKEKLWADFEKQLHWIGVMRDHERPAQKEFYERLYELYNKKRNGSYQWPLFFFLPKNRKWFFMFTKKNLTSQLV